MMDAKHAEFFRELRKLVKKYRVNIYGGGVNGGLSFYFFRGRKRERANYYIEHGFRLDTTLIEQTVTLEIPK